MTTRGAFVDPSSGIRWDTNGGDNDGWLSKKSKWLGEIRSRFFILKGSKLFFSEDERKAPHGMIDLVDCVSVKPHGDNSTIEIATRLQVFVLMADSPEARDRWVKSIDAAIIRQSSLYYDNGIESDNEDA